MCEDREGAWVQVGVYSSGDNCKVDSGFALFTVVSKFRHWMDQVMKADYLPSSKLFDLLYWADP